MEPMIELDSSLDTAVCDPMVPEFFPIRRVGRETVDTFTLDLSVPAEASYGSFTPRPKKSWTVWSMPASTITYESG